MWGLEFEQVAPEVSIVVCAQNRAEATLACLEALQTTQRWNATRFEVVLVDDGSTDAVADLGRVPGLVYLRLDQNRGFLRAANAGIEAARGRHVLFLGNDTLPQGTWLDDLAGTLRRRPRAGVVGARLVYPEGWVQEAGAIIFRDASGWHYGRLTDPEDPRVTFERQVDYCSSAALLVRDEVLRALGGFDERFAPAHYADTDLCFAARDLGWEVWYQPDAIVVHQNGTAGGREEHDGGKDRAANRATFSRKWAHVLAGQAPADIRFVPVARRRRARGHVLVFDREVPTPDRDSGSRRLTAILRGLVELGHAVTYVPHNGWRRPPYTRRLERLGIEVLGGPEAHWDLVREMSAGLSHAWVARPEVAQAVLPRLQADLPHLPVVYDTVDLHFLREQRQADLIGDPQLAAQAEDTRRLELAAAQAAAAVVVVSPVERDMLSAMTGTPVYVIPNLHEVGPARPRASASDEILFVGGFHHRPNEDAVEWFVREVWPRVHGRIPSARFLIAGSHPTARVDALASETVEVVGWVPHLPPLYARVRAAVAPLRYGAGLKGKVGEALSLGVPMVMTSIAAEGAYIEDGADALVADDPANFAECLVRLLRDDDLWLALSRKGQRLIEERFTAAAVLPVLDGLLEGLRHEGAARDGRRMMEGAAQ